MDHVDVAGLRIAYQRRGEGPGLLLLHGAVSDSRVWRVELESLSDTFTVVAWDAPGCGASSEPSTSAWRSTPEVFDAEVRDFLIKIAP